MKVLEVSRSEFFKNLTLYVKEAMPIKITDFRTSLLENLHGEKGRGRLLNSVTSPNIHFLTCPNDQKGRYFYNEALNGFNFETGSCSLKEFFSLLENTEHEEQRFYAAQAIPTGVVFNDEANSWFHCEELADHSVDVRAWIGNQCNTAAHFDFAHNIAYVVAGKRKFTLFPPEQITNLYIGPISLSPGGTPISLVDASSPDFIRYPRYAQALENSIEVELCDGEAIFIPSLWWHSVQSISNENMLLNYWWRNDKSKEGLPFDSMVFLMSFIPTLPLSERKAWKAIFDYFVFQTEVDPKLHLPDTLHDILVNLTSDDKKSIHQWFKKKL